MLNAYAGLITRTGEWFERAAEAGWFDQADRHRLAAVERATPADLFAAGQARPLVVGLFGGTGVGKSSLLNRLAGAPIARVGVERPTSRDVTLYVHELVELADLPAELPVDRVQIKRHNSAAQREILWIDAPDIDSVDESNRQCALSWLPHIDLLCYVVSPERYRDDAGWRVLRERGFKHGWLFVMNRWDEGNARQREDFQQMLRGAGFDQPLLLCTCCADAPSPLPTPDEFPQIQETMRELINAHAVQELTRLGHRARMQELRAAVEELRQRFGEEARWDVVRAALRDRWGRLRAQLLQGLAWAMQTTAARFAVRESSFVQRVGRQVAGLRGGGAKRDGADGAAPDPGEMTALTASLWDDWSQAKLEGLLDALEIAAGRSGLATSPLRSRLDQVAADARRSVTDPVQDQVRAALTQPGSRAVRIGRRITGFLTTALPTTALAVVGYFVAAGYYRAASGSGEFFGTPFATHSVLLVLVAWALPFMVDRLLRPSVEAAVLRALRGGFGSGCDGIEAALAEQLDAAAAEADTFCAEGDTLLKEAAAVMLKPVDPRNPALARLIRSGRPGAVPEPVSGAGGQ